jgi:hypothetical protein
MTPVYPIGVVKTFNPTSKERSSFGLKGENQFVMMGNELCCNHQFGRYWKQGWEKESESLLWN